MQVVLAHTQGVLTHFIVPSRVRGSSQVSPHKENIFLNLRFNYKKIIDAEKLKFHFILVLIHSIKKKKKNMKAFKYESC